MNFLDKAGLTYFWSKIKNYIKNKKFIDSPDESIKHIIELTYDEYKSLEEIDPDTEYHIIDAQSSLDSLQATLDNLQSQIDNINTKMLSAETGSSTNGSYTKYSNGDMIIKQKVTGVIDVTTTTSSLESIYRSNDIVLPDFPIQFIDIPTVTYTGISTGTLQYWVMSSESNTPSKRSAGKLQLVRPVSRTGVTYEINIIAIGKWK